MDGDYVPVSSLLYVDAAGVVAQVASRQPFPPDAVRGAADAGRALDDDVSVGWLLAEDGEGGEPFVRYVLQLLRATKDGDGNSLPSKSNQTGVTWGWPSGRTVARAAT